MYIDKINIFDIASKYVLPLFGAFETEEFATLYEFKLYALKST